MSILTISQKHGKEMYINGLQHAINMFEIGEMGGYSISDTVTTLKKRIEEEQQAIKEIEAQEAEEAKNV